MRFVVSVRTVRTQFGLYGRGHYHFSSVGTRESEGQRGYRIRVSVDTESDDRDLMAELASPEAGRPTVPVGTVCVDRERTRRQTLPLIAGETVEESDVPVATIIIPTSGFLRLQAEGNSTWITDTDSQCRCSLRDEYRV